MGLGRGLGRGVLSIPSSSSALARVILAVETKGVIVAVVLMLPSDGSLNGLATDPGLGEGGGMLSASSSLVMMYLLLMLRRLDLEPAFLVLVGTDMGEGDPSTSGEGNSTGLPFVLMRGLAGLVVVKGRTFLSAYMQSCCLVELGGGGMRIITGYSFALSSKQEDK